MNILLTNDDGIFSEGLNSLAELLLKLKHNVVIIAPDGNRSAFSHSASFYKEIVIEKIDSPLGCDSFKLSGTPVDCVLYGIYNYPIKFDLVIAGINRGENLGVEIFYSGTVACGLEAVNHNIKSICFSNHSLDCPNYFESCRFIEKYFDEILEYTSKDYVLNINIPNLSLEEIKGIRSAKLGTNYYDEYYHKIEGKENIYVLTGDPIYDTNIDSDSYLLTHGYVTICPLVLPSLSKEGYEKVKEINKDF